MTLGTKDSENMHFTRAINTSSANSTAKYLSKSRSIFCKYENCFYKLDKANDLLDETFRFRFKNISLKNLRITNNK
jgi:hypothetical protein